MPLSPLLRCFSFRGRRPVSILMLIGLSVLSFPIQAFALTLTKEQHYQSGELKANLGRYESAIEDFTRAIAEDKVYLDAYLARASAYHKEGLDDKAVFDYNKAIFIDANNFTAYKGRADSYATLGVFDNADRKSVV